jgi:hypothetical protein
MLPMKCCGRRFRKSKVFEREFSCSTQAMHLTALGVPGASAPPESVRLTSLQCRLLHFRFFFVRIREL